MGNTKGVVIVAHVITGAPRGSLLGPLLFYFLENTIRSKAEKVNRGVPQGSLLDPLLFLLFTVVLPTYLVS